MSERSLAALLVLIDAGPDGASFEELMRGAWLGAVVGEDTVKKRISLLRQQLGTQEGDRSEAQLIQSMRGRGYRLAVPAERLSPRRVSARMLGGLATVASVALALIFTVSPAAGLDTGHCQIKAPGPLVSEISVVADAPYTAHQERLAAETERAVINAGQMGDAAPYRMSAHLTMEQGEPVLELTLRCGTDAESSAWVMRYLVDPGQPGGADEAVNDLLARVSARMED